MAENTLDGSRINVQRPIGFGRFDPIINKSSPGRTNSSASLHAVEIDHLHTTVDRRICVSSGPLWLHGARAQAIRAESENRNMCLIPSQAAV